MEPVGVFYVGAFLALAAISAGLKYRRARKRSFVPPGARPELFRWARAAGYDVDDATNPELAELGDRICGLAGELDDAALLEPPIAEFPEPRSMRVIARRVREDRQQLLLEVSTRHPVPHSIGALTTSASAFSGTLDLDAGGQLHRQGRLPELTDGRSFEQVLAELGGPYRIRFAAGQMIVMVPGLLTAERGQSLDARAVAALAGQVGETEQRAHRRRGWNTDVRDAREPRVTDIPVIAWPARSARAQWSLDARPVGANEPVFAAIVGLASPSSGGALPAAACDHHNQLKCESLA